MENILKECKSPLKNTQNLPGFIAFIIYMSI